MAATSNTKKYLLAVDHGTSGVKTALFSVRGELIGFESEKTPTYFLPAGGAEQDPADWWNALIDTTKRLLARRLVPVEDIVGIGVSSTFSSTVAVDRQGRHLCNSLTWMDSRGAPYVKEVVSGFPSIDGYNIFTMLPWIWKTGGGPQLSGKDDIAHVLWWKRERPEIYQAAHMFLGSKDYLNLRLTGQFAASFDSIMLFWVTNTRDINRVHYDDGLIRKLQIDRAKLPPLRSSVEVLGILLPEVAEELGLSPGVKVVMGSPDHQSACIGSGAVRDFEGHLYVGTSSWVQCVVPFKKTDMFHSIASLPTAIPGRYYCVNEQDIAGGALNFLVDRILFPRNQLRPEAPAEDVYERLDQIAAAVPAGSNGVIFTPWLNGERTPVDDTTIRAGFHNLSLSTSLEQMVRAVYEGVALNTRWALKYVERFIGRKMDPINIVGGGARSDLWCRIFADVLDRTIRQVEHPIWANARGAALIAAVALGFISFDDIPGLVKYANTFQPDSGNRRLYDEIFTEFLNIYKNNRAMYRRLNQVH
ncbi:MAG: xylulose kinase [Deltaproteobacteria bacterium RBG_13_61_14]|nr:MAG: xylulose kinase [Deltaproteobacteria bacterium RBG_13_61_14]